MSEIDDVDELIVRLRDAKSDAESKDREIAELKEKHPDLYQIALDMEAGYRTGKHWRGDAATRWGWDVGSRGPT